MTHDGHGVENAVKIGTYFHPSERTMLFIDGNNFHHSTKALEIAVDFSRLRTFFEGRCGLIKRIYYYTALPSPDKNNQTTRHLAHWLSHNGFTVVSKDIREYTSGKGERVQKGNLDVEIAVNCMELIPVMDHAILFSGDSDFLSLVHTLKQKGVRVTVVSTTKTPTPVVSNELRMAADNYIDISTIREEIQHMPTWSSSKNGTESGTTKSTQVKEMGPSKPLECCPSGR